MNLSQIETKVAAYLSAVKQAGAWTEAHTSISGLLDKIAKTYQIDGLFPDKLEFLDGDTLEFGKTLEEWYQNLDSITDYDSNGASTLAPTNPEYMKPAYSYSLGKKVIPTTVRMNDYERAVKDAGEFASLTNTVLKRLYDTFAVFKYDCKKKLIANFADACVNAGTSGTKQGPETVNPVQYHASSTTTAASKALVLGDRYYIGANMAGATNVAVCVKSRTSTSKTWKEQIAEGYLVEINLVEKIAKPVDDSTGEAFITKVKECAETAGFVNEGNSLNGNTIGAEQGLVLIIKKGIKPVLDTQVMAGAFNPENLAIPCEIVVVDDIPCTTDTSKDIYAVLMDRRACRLHNDYMAVREQENAQGNFINYFLHTESTAAYSRNCFVKVFQEA